MSVIKQHLCGVSVAYEEFIHEGPNGPSLYKQDADKGRPNGSLYNRQKRAIADATEYLRLKLSRSRQRKPLIFVLTTPGYTSVANLPKFISCFVENMRTNYGMGEYVWVREHTKKGYPHFHFIAEWNEGKWFFEKIVYRGKIMPRITAISLYWSGLFGSDAVNSVRLGSFHPKTKRRTLYVSHSKQCWYLTKYIGKSIGDNSNDSYLCEAGFPATKYKKAVRSFAISEMLREWCEPLLFKTVWYFTDTGEEYSSINDRLERNDVGAMKYREVSRRFECWSHGLLLELTEADLLKYNWKWTGHGETFIGFRRYSQT